MRKFAAANRSLRSARQIPCTLCSRPLCWYFCWYRGSKRSWRISLFQHRKPDRQAQQVAALTTCFHSPLILTKVSVAMNGVRATFTHDQYVIGVVVGCHSRIAAQVRPSVQIFRHSRAPDQQARSVRCSDRRLHIARCNCVRRKKPSTWGSRGSRIEWSRTGGDWTPLLMRLLRHPCFSSQVLSTAPIQSLKPPRL
jgi:hypothetical protein